MLVHASKVVSKGEEVNGEGRGEERTEAMSQVDSTFGKSRRARCSDAALLSQMAPTLQPSTELKFLAIRGPQYP